MSTKQANVLISLVLVAIVLLGYFIREAEFSTERTTKLLGEIKESVSPIYGWEYETLKCNTEGNSRTGKEALRPASIHLEKGIIQEMGKDGWELISSYLELETAYPNFGNDDYVTGLRDNVRPQNLVLIFRRPIRGSKPSR